MYWLLSATDQKKVRNEIDSTVNNLSITESKVQQKYQVFPFQGRKVINQAQVVIESLTNDNSSIVDPFMGSGTFAYAGNLSGRKVFANEYEPYTYKMASSPYNNRPSGYEDSCLSFITSAKKQISHYYETQCGCGETVVVDSLFFDLVPLKYTNITKHERLAKCGENVIFRGASKCKNCGAVSKKFDTNDEAHMRRLNSTISPPEFTYQMIENSRINLTGTYTQYSNLFPMRSKLVFSEMWKLSLSMNFDDNTVDFIQETLLSILPQAKYKDYRSKSQDLHVPPNRLRESNLINRFESQAKKRGQIFKELGLTKNEATLSCMDFRDFFAQLKLNSMDLIITDPPWSDGNAYFEKAQLYHPWINFNLQQDTVRLRKEVVVSNAPSRVDKRNSTQWWDDIEELFKCSFTSLKTHSYLVLFFRPVPANKWIENLNFIKLKARKAGFEPLLSIDIDAADPSMRVQQSCHYAFSSDIVMIFLKLEESERRNYFGDIDLDELAYRAAVYAQDENFCPFLRSTWNKFFHKLAKENNLLSLDLPKNSILKDRLFIRMCDQVGAGVYLPKPSSPYSDELFGTPYIERVSLHVPYVIEDLLKNGTQFTFDQFLLKIAEYVENGTRSIIGEILADGSHSLQSLLALYADPVPGGKFFTAKGKPSLLTSTTEIMKLDPYEFEIFCAELLVCEGYTNVVVAGRSGDRGVDIRCNDADGNLVIAQCKRYTKSNISATPLQRLHSFARTRGATKIICMTTTGYTPDAKDEASKIGAELDVELIAREELDQLVNKHNLLGN